MRNSQKILIGIFCLGIVLAGAGTGMAFLEFSTFTYAGEKEAGEMDRKTLTLDYAFEAAAEEPLTIGRNYGRYANNNEVIEVKRFRRTRCVSSLPIMQMWCSHI